MATNVNQPFIPQQPQQPVQQPMAPPFYAPQQPQMPQQAPAPQPQMQTRTTMGGDEVLDGAGVPPELRGRKVSEAMKIYSALADDFIRRGRNNNQQPQGQQQTQQQQMQQQQQNNAAQRQQFQQPQQQQSPDFWQNPDERISQIVKQVVSEAVGPFQQQSQSQGIQTAMQRARESIPDFQTLEPDILNAVKGSSAESLARPEFWEHAADLARGKRSRPGQANPHSPPQQETPQIFNPNARPAPQPYQPQQPPQQNYPQPTAPPTLGQQVPPGQNPAVPQFPTQRPPTNQFFSEQPTAPSPYQNTHAGSLSPQELQVAQLAGMSAEQYMAWKNIQQKAR